MSEAIDSIADKCGQTEANSGFREDWELAGQLERIAEKLEAEAAYEFLIIDQSDVLRKAAKALRNHYVGMKLMLTVCELAEAVETLRDHGVDGLLDGQGNFGEELTDAHIRLWALENLMNVNSGHELDKKMNKNTTRPHKHGREL